MANAMAPSGPARQEGLFPRLRRLRRDREELRELIRLPDERLLEIGIGRETLDREAAKPWHEPLDLPRWRSPTAR